MFVGNFGEGLDEERESFSGGEHAGAEDDGLILEFGGSWRREDMGRMRIDPVINSDGASGRKDPMHVCVHSLGDADVPSSGIDDALEHGASAAKFFAVGDLAEVMIGDDVGDPVAAMNLFGEVPVNGGVMSIDDVWGEFLGEVQETAPEEFPCEFHLPLRVWIGPVFEGWYGIIGDLEIMSGDVIPLVGWRHVDPRRGSWDDSEWRGDIRCGADDVEVGDAG